MYIERKAISWLRKKCGIQDELRKKVSLVQPGSNDFDQGIALGIWILGCSLFYKRELLASKSAGAKGDVPKICRFVHPLHPC